jgi:GNAT superfamily N-acetyltransferase
MRDANHAAVRPFEPDDADAVSALIATTMRESNARDYPADRIEALIAYFTPDKLRLLARERDCIIALSGTQVIGTAAREGNELETFFVHPRHQGGGVGSRMLKELEEGARRDGISRLQVDASVTGAAFYEHRGYRRTGQVVRGTAGPQITLTKDLDADVDAD